MRNNLTNKLILSWIIACLMIFFGANSLFAASAVLSWDPSTTNADGTQLNDLAGYKVYYGTGSGNYSGSVDVGNVLTYQVNNLSSGVAYYFATTAYDTADNESQYSAEISRTFSGNDITPPVISGIQTANITDSSITVSWTTDEASDAKVQYGTTTSYGMNTPVNSSMVTSHSQKISGIAASTLYHYRMISSDAAGNKKVTDDYTFTTVAAPEPVYYYCDSDNDGYAGTSIYGSCTGEGCEPSGCQIMPGSDCNDSNAGISPDAADDTCDGIDDNCDGTADNNYVISVVSCGTGVCSSVGQLECQAGEEVNICDPGMPTEDSETICGDSLDNDCDGQVDEGCFPDIEVSRVLIGEDFSAGIPETWSQDVAWNTDNECGRTIGEPFEGPYAIADSSCAVTGVDKLVTHTFDTTSCDTVTLDFSNQYYRYSGNVKVNMSSDGGVTWENSISVEADDGYPVPNWKEIDISSVAGSSEAQIKFIYENDAEDGFWALDNVWVTCQSDQVKFSAQVQDVMLKTVMVTNRGEDDLIVDMINVEGVDASEFSIGENEDCTNQALLPGESCTVDIIFAPLSSGAKSANVIISSNDPDTPALSVALAGTGVADMVIVPVPVIKVNGLSGIVNVARWSKITPSIELDTGSFNGEDADWWVLLKYRGRWYHYDKYRGRWKIGYSVYKQGPLNEIGLAKALDSSKFPEGRFTMYFGVDTEMNGVQDSDGYYYDSVIINVK
ncbi:exoglucanase B precursor [bacterium BMS3Bbin09]|nr:exoglucanase B precursor [bacterium BMS3Bbin09]